MADFKLVGAVAIKVRPDTTKFREETEAGVAKELRGFSAKVKVEADVELDGKQAEAAAKKLEKDLEKTEINWSVKIDRDSVRAAQKQFEKLIIPTETVKIEFETDDEIDATRAKLEEMAEAAKVHLTYVDDEKGYQAVLDRIAALRREKLEIPVEFNTNEEMDALEAEMREKLANLAGPPIVQRFDLSYNENQAGLEKAMAQIEAELAKIDAIQIDFELNRDNLLSARAFLHEALLNKGMDVSFNPDEAGYQGVLNKIRSIQRERAEVLIHIGLTDAELAETAAEIEAKIEALKPQATLEIDFNPDRASLEATIAKIDAALTNLHADIREVELNREALMHARDEAQALLRKAPIWLTYEKNAEGMLKALKDLDAEMNKHLEMTISTAVDPKSIEATKAWLQEQLEQQTIRIEYDENLASLQAAKKRIEGLLHIEPLAIVTKLDENSLREALAKVEAMIAAHTPAPKEITVKADVQPKVNLGHYAKVMAALKALTKSQTVGIIVSLKNAGVLTAMAKLTGLRAAARWTEEFAKSLGRLDRNLPIVAALTIALSTLASGLVSMTASAFSLGNGLGEVLRMAGLLAPTLMLGFGAVMTVFTGVFKDFGAAVNGDEKAIKKLSDSGRKAAAEIRPIFQGIREVASQNFWDAAGDSMLKFTRTALPAFGDGIAQLSTSLGGVFSNVLDSYTTLAEQGGMKVFFDNLTRGFDASQKGVASFMDAFNTLGVAGSTIFPRLGKAFDAWAGRFNAWTQQMVSDGSFSRWVEEGIQGLKDLFIAGGSIVKVWGNIGQAAQAAGAATLHSFSQSMKRLEEVTAGSRFQTNMRNIFEGAREASNTFHKALVGLAPAMDTFSITMKNSLSGAGAALGAFIATMGDVMSSPMLNTGILSFMSGLKDMFVSLRPAAGAFAEILMNFGDILGTVARDAGPLFRDLFVQLSSVLTSAWGALEPFLPGLMQIGTTIVNVLGPALSEAASVFIPAFASGLQKIGDGLIPLVKIVADVATGFVDWFSGLDVTTIVGLTVSVLALSGAMRFAAVVVPLAAAALNLIGNTAVITAAKIQLMIPVIGIGIAAATGLAAIGLSAMATNMKSGIPYATEYADALRQDAEAAGQLGSAVGEATKKLTIQKLVQAGAYDDAKKIGIGAKEMTDAVLAGGDAYQTLMERVEGAAGGYNELRAQAELAARQQGGYKNTSSAVVKGYKEQSDAGNKLKNILGDINGSMVEGRKVNEVYVEVNGKAAINTGKHAEKVVELSEAATKASKGLGAASAASQVLQDTFSSGPAKIDAMRKTLDLMLGRDAKQQVAESLGAYVTGFNNLKETVAPVAQSLRNLGDAAYGENGFLNVAGGNKAVLQVNQALVDQVNNVWLGAKAAYDAAIQQGDNAQTAFEKAQQFISERKGDYDALAEASGVSAERVNGQWEAVFGKEWVLKLSLNGAVEAAQQAQYMILAIKGQFDGKEFMAYLDANPSAALKAISDPVGAAQDYVNATWKAKLEAAPEEAQEAIFKLTGMTREQWNEGDFQALLKVADKVPGLTEAIMAIRNGANGDYKAFISAMANSSDLAWVEFQLNNLARGRTVQYEIEYTDFKRDQAMENRMGGSQYNGSIIDGLGRGKHGFGMQPVKHFANGGIEKHVAQITKPGGPIRVWAERETFGEAYIPYAQSKRPRSVSILSQVAKDFGYSLIRAQEFANGGTYGNTSTAPVRTSSTSVTVGTINTVDPESAVRKLQTMQRDALAVAGII